MVFESNHHRSLPAAEHFHQAQFAHAQQGFVHRIVSGQSGHVPSGVIRVAGNHLQLLRFTGNGHPLGGSDFNADD
ncbi:MAG TPA: hypothetical protein PK510_10685, partial [Ottowia sp.]|nr:hypothetical protein [Ottowia sp.]